MKKVHLTQEQRYAISVMYRQGYKQKEIAQAIGKDKSVISRELKRNANLKGRYSFEYAKDMASLRKERNKKPRKFSAGLEKDIIKLIKQGWSPKQITGRLKHENKPYVSHERIYQIIRKDRKEGGILYQYTRHKLKHRKRPVSGKSSPIKNRVGIEHRPEIVNQRGRFGDWEIDLIIGKDNKGAILTMVERKTAYFMMQKLKYGKNAKQLAKEAWRLLFPYKEFVHTITGDNGGEFAEHQAIAKSLNASFFFTDPYSSWQKGLIENTNKLIRQYIPKEANFNDFNDQQIKEIQYKINNRPREKLNFYSPKEIFFLNLQNQEVAFNC